MKEGPSILASHGTGKAVRGRWVGIVAERAQRRLRLDGVTGQWWWVVVRCDTGSINGDDGCEVWRWWSLGSVLMSDGGGRVARLWCGDLVSVVSDEKWLHVVGRWGWFMVAKWMSDSGLTTVVVLGVCYGWFLFNGFMGCRLCIYAIYAHRNNDHE